ncbi:hypothetical protein BUZ69_10355 [Staphylococcus saprophyticus]|uniref:hypothetical protein n=1 Tax=Staphylococcus saprophyticus TaxID=29385 RepID=UPI000D1F436B|nr:hypothetical protein [Staphylococcus saprophyticus]PTK45466.1 hypothetical protein BUZ69_10355 [Staphylococcus saprophyticus]
MKKFSELNTDYLYVGEPTDFGYTDSFAYHCKNWVFSLEKTSDGEFYMHDTFWKYDENAIKVSEDNIGKFTPLFDITKVKKIPDTDERFMYDSNDIYEVLDQNQFHARVTYYKKINASKKLNNQIEVLQERKERKKYELDKVQREYDDIAEELNKLEAKKTSAKNGFTVNF